MAVKALTGIDTIKIGDPLPNGVMGTTLTSIGKLVDDSIQITFAEPTKTKITCEDTTAPLVVLVDPNVEKKFEFSTYDFDPDILARFFGGSNVLEKWSSPTSYDAIEQSVEIVTKDVDGTHFKITIPRANISASMEGKIGKKGLGIIKIICEVLTPFDGSNNALSEIQFENIAAS